MRRINEVRDQELIWTQTGCRKPEYQLWADDEVVATRRWQRGSLAVAETADGRWSFNRPGFRRSRVSVRAVGAQASIATFSSGWTGSGVLEMLRGSYFHWSAANLRRSRWAWQDSDGTPLVRFESRQGIVKVEGG